MSDTDTTPVAPETKGKKVKVIILGQSVYNGVVYKKEYKVVDGKVTNEPKVITVTEDVAENIECKIVN